MSDSNERSPSLRRRAVRIETGGEASDFRSGPQRVTMVPLTIRRRHNRKLLTPPPGEHSVLGAEGLDAPMIKTLGKAFYWLRLLQEGQYESGNELARAFKLEPGWVAEVLRLTLLAPDIVEAILEGRQPRHLNLQTLRGRIELLPREWALQRPELGFAAIRQ
jgi:hypothetical protein